MMLHEGTDEMADLDLDSQGAFRCVHLVNIPVKSA